jgi:hypothetical protein
MAISLGRVRMISRNRVPGVGRAVNDPPHWWLSYPGRVTALAAGPRVEV